MKWWGLQGWALLDSLLSAPPTSALDTPPLDHHQHHRHYAEGASAFIPISPSLVPRATSFRRRIRRHCTVHYASEASTATGKKRGRRKQTGDGDGDGDSDGDSDNGAAAAVDLRTASRQKKTAYRRLKVIKKYANSASSAAKPSSGAKADDGASSAIDRLLSRLGDKDRDKQADNTYAVPQTLANLPPVKPLAERNTERKDLYGWADRLAQQTDLPPPPSFPPIYDAYDRPPRSRRPGGFTSGSSSSSSGLGMFLPDFGDEKVENGVVVTGRKRRPLIVELPAPGPPRPHRHEETILNLIEGNRGEGLLQGGWLAPTLQEEASARDEGPSAPLRQSSRRRRVWITQGKTEWPRDDAVAVLQRELDLFRRMPSTSVLHLSFLHTAGKNGGDGGDKCEEKHLLLDLGCLLAGSNDVRESVLAELKDLMEDPAVTKVVHNASPIIIRLQREWGLYIVNIFDTVVAGQRLNMLPTKVADRRSVARNANNQPQPQQPPLSFGGLMEPAPAAEPRDLVSEYVSFDPSPSGVWDWNQAVEGLEHLCRQCCPEMKGVLTIEDDVESDEGEQQQEQQQEGGSSDSDLSGILGSTAEAAPVSEWHLMGTESRAVVPADLPMPRSVELSMMQWGTMLLHLHHHLSARLRQDHLAFMARREDGAREGDDADGLTEDELDEEEDMQEGDESDDRAESSKAEMAHRDAQRLTLREVVYLPRCRGPRVLNAIELRIAHQLLNYRASDISPFHRYLLADESILELSQKALTNPRIPNKYLPIWDDVFAKIKTLRDTHRAVTHLFVSERRILRNQDVYETLQRLRLRISQQIPWWHLTSMHTGSHTFGGRKAMAATPQEAAQQRAMLEQDMYRLFREQLEPPADESRVREDLRQRLETLLQSSGRAGWSDISLQLYGSSVNQFGGREADVDLLCQSPDRDHHEILMGDQNAMAKVTRLFENGTLELDMRAPIDVATLPMPVPAKDEDGEQRGAAESDEEGARREPLRVQRIAEVLEQGGYENVTWIAKTKAPIVKFVDPVSGLEGDIGIQNRLPIHNTDLLATYAQAHPIVRPFVYLVKHWAKSRGINNPKIGLGFSSYAYVLMALFVLQREGIIPSYQQLPCNAGALVWHQGSWYDCRYHTPAHDTQRDHHNHHQQQQGSAPEVSLASLLLRFFDFYANFFDPERDVVSVREGRLLSKYEKGWHIRSPMASHFWPVEDPFETEIDLSRVMRDREAIDVVLYEFQRAHLMLDAGQSLSSLLEPCDELPTMADTTVRQLV
ncbi:unnamed protein product [Vitrella brassicaformis CCMP3155]|uniref:Uncharacterized protein n=3 Tax=Vitrella brassicaformis TaxID=1169539 RepID=A0A0G4FST8_VITBC|nr:unnamed protein product [Vitrella brassicaformis CCMP3155]|eukprot:CEM17726.1 unnamed protein product [Vitrella brassicaformis CCMP3155]